MPTFDVYKVSLFTHQDQRQFVNTMFYEVGPIQVIDAFEEAKALADTWVTFFQTAWQGVVSNVTSFGCVKIEKVKGSPIPTFIQFFSNVKGTQVGKAMPDNMTMVIRRRHDVGGNAFRSLLHISGFRVLDTDGSFLNAAFVSGQLQALVVLFNDQMVSSASFNLAEWNPVIPHTQRVYGNKLAVSIDAPTNTITLTAGGSWSALGFITGGQFAIRAPSPDKGTYSIIVSGGSPALVLTENNVESTGADVISCQQVTVPTAYFSLGSTIPQTAVRQLNNRRSSHTGIVA